MLLINGNVLDKDSDDDDDNLLHGQAGSPVRGRSIAEVAGTWRHGGRSRPVKPILLAIQITSGPRRSAIGRGASHAAPQLRATR